MFLLGHFSASINLGTKSIGISETWFRADFENVKNFKDWLNVVWDIKIFIVGLHFKINKVSIVGKINSSTIIQRWPKNEDDLKNEDDQKMETTLNWGHPQKWRQHKKWAQPQQYYLKKLLMTFHFDRHSQLTQKLSNRKKKITWWKKCVWYWACTWTF